MHGKRNALQVLHYNVFIKTSETLKWPSLLREEHSLSIISNFLQSLIMNEISFILTVETWQNINPESTLECFSLLRKSKIDF